MLDIELCKQLLKLEDDWHVAEIELDEPSHRIDITVRFGAPIKKSLFKRANTDTPQETITSDGTAPAASTFSALRTMACHVGGRRPGDSDVGGK